MMHVDTDVLIWYLRGNARAAEALHQSGWRLSAVAYMELVQGARDKGELSAIRRSLARQGAEIVPLDEATTSRAVLYMERHAHAHGLRLVDALIAATAVVAGQRLLTGNSQHYRAVAELTVEPFAPT